MALPDDLPAGRLVTPKVWIADEPSPEATLQWVTAHMAYAETGWWPLLLPTDLDIDVFGPARTEDIDAERFLAERWADDEIARGAQHPPLAQRDTKLLCHLAGAGP